MARRELPVGWQCQQREGQTCPVFDPLDNWRCQLCPGPEFLSSAGLPETHRLCAGLHGGCQDCREVWLTGLEMNVPGSSAKPGMCMIDSHKHWPWEPHADHQWADGCPYEGLDCPPADARALADRQLTGCQYDTGTCWCPQGEFRYGQCQAPSTGGQP